MRNDYKAFDVVRVNFGDAAFAGEQGGIRPAVIVQNNCGNKRSPSTIVMPFTSQIKHLDQPTHSLFMPDGVNGLTKDSMLLGECIRQVSEDRIIEKMGYLTGRENLLKVKQVYEANFPF